MGRARLCLLRDKRAVFPNFFMLNGPTGPVGNFSLIDIAEMQWGYIEQLLKPLQTGDAASLEPQWTPFLIMRKNALRPRTKNHFQQWLHELVSG